MGRKIIGIEIRDDRVSIAHIGREKGKMTITSLGSTILPPNIIHSGEIQDIVLFQEQLIHLLSNKGLWRRPYLLGISTSQAWVRKLQIPNVPKKELHKIIHYRGENILPYPIEKVFYRYQLLRKEKTGYQILLTAIPKKIVNGYLQLSRNLRLPVKRISLQAFGLFNLAVYRNELASFTGLLTRMTQNSADIMLITNGQLELMRTVELDHDHFKRFLRELHSTLEHFQSENGQWLKTGIFLGSKKIITQLRDEMVDFHWRQFPQRNPVIKKLPEKYQEQFSHLASLLGLALPEVVSR